jgi:uncharacterized membrane protein
MHHKPTTMICSITNVLLILTATTTALMAGLFYSWSISVMPGIARLSDKAFVDAMSAMNKAILNPVFLLPFLGTAILLPVITWMHYSTPLTPKFWLLLAAALVYLAGVMAVTMAGNVPLNNMLAAFSTDGASAQDIALKRTAFEGTWNRLNHIRSLCSTLTVVLVIIACIWKSEPVQAVTNG